jgi:type IV pilus assembly protein PilB
MPTSVKELGVLLIQAGALTREHLQEAIEEQSRTHQRLGEILLRRNYIRESDLLGALALQLDLRHYDPARDDVEAGALAIVPIATARRYNLVPIRVDGSTLTVAMADPLDVIALDDVRNLAKREVEVLVAPTEVLQALRERHYARVEGSKNVEDAVQRAIIELGDVDISDEELNEDEAKRRAQDAPIITLVEQVISQALQERATDIHVEPLEKGLVIRYRVDGLLYDALTPGRTVYAGVSSRIKILANMDIAERRAPQDGRFSVRTGGREVDIRVSAVPTIHGEKLVLRLLDKTGFSYSLRDLGFSERHYKMIVEAIHQPYGMVLLSGPTGSGKSTTLYAGLLELPRETINIMTVEDPVEYQIDRINQVQVNERKKVTFATALRSFLRQDPDVIMVGEMRDRDTADIGVRAAMTGHMVFSTIHANDAPTTAVRLVSMGIEPFQAASALTLVAAQRLVRRNCRHCLEAYEPRPELLLGIADLMTEEMMRAPGTFTRGRGCAECRGRGYSGRVAIIEMMKLGPALRRLVVESRSADEIRRVAQSEGMTTLKQSGLEKALDGLTTVEEVLRVCLTEE